MVLISILLCAGLAYFFAVFLKNKKVGYSLAFTFIGLFIIGLVLLIANEYGHFGMEKVTTEKTYQIQSVQKGTNLLLEKKLGTNGKESVYVYRTPETAKAKKPQTTKVNSQVKNVVKTGNYKNATVTKKTIRWEYKNGFYSFLFGISDNNTETVYGKVRHFHRIMSGIKGLKIPSVRRLQQMLKWFMEWRAAVIKTAKEIKEENIHRAWEELVEKIKRQFEILIPQYAMC